MKPPSRAKSLFSNANFWYGIGVCFGIAHVTALLIVLIVTGTLYFARCPSVNGRPCNNRGTCDDVTGICTCTDPFFSGDACEITLAPGYSYSSNQVCSGNGILSTPLVNSTHIPPECREEQPSAANRFKRTGGGWQTRKCFEKVQDIIKRFLTTDGLNVTDDELFSLPLCQCFPPYTGLACDVTSCPINSELEVCSGNGNKSVTYTHNNTQTGNGCQCDAQIVKLLSPNLGYTSFAYRQLREKSIAFRLHQPMCGKLVTHRTKPDLKLVLTQGLVQTQRLYTCKCDELHFGEACEFGVCPEVDEKICNNHGHPAVGLGFERNTTRNDPACQPVCPPGQVLCPNTRDCRASSALCSVPASCVSANPRFPIRCRDGSCVAKPLRTDTVSDYSFGFDESALDSPVTQCFPSQYVDPASFLTATDYRQLLSACAGDEGLALVNSRAEPVFVPSGKLWFDSSLISVLVEFTYNDDDGDGGSSSSSSGLTLSYRNQQVRLFPPATSDDLHVQIALFNESYEEKANRIIRYVNRTVDVDPVGGGMVDIYPFPTMHDSSRMLPERWSGETVYLRSDAVGAVVQVRPSSTRIEYTSSGTWFIANISETRAVIPGGNIVPIAECLEDLSRCVWNAETRLSYDESRILCGSRTSSTNFGCTVVQPLPESYIRFEVVLTGMLLTPNLDQYDWQGSGPWYMSQHLSGNAPASDVDFSYDGEFLFIDNPGNVTVRRMAYVQLRDIIVPNACPPTQVNASTLNSRWFLQSGRRKEGYIPLTGKSYAIGQILHPLKGLHLVRGLVVSNTSLLVKGYDDPVPVLTMREITPSEFRRGLQYEDVHVFPAVCADGSPAHIKHVEFHNITVKCDCDAASTTALACTCRDHLLRQPYRCACSIDAGGGSCACAAGPGETDYLYPVETFLLAQLQAVHAGEADWGYCYFHDASQQARPITRANPVTWSRVHAETDADGAVQVARVPGSAALLEIYLPCRRVVNQTTGETEAYNLTDAGVALFGRVSLYSDYYQEVPLDVLSGCSSPGGEGQISLRPILTSYFEDKYDDWIFEGPPHLQVEFKFAPGGVPIQNMSISVSSNDEDKLNVLWNDFTVWRSDDETDLHPTLTVAFNQTRTVTGLYLVLETAGVPVFSLLDNQTVLGPDVNISMTIPVEVLVEGSTDGGTTWYLLETVVSSVYRGEEDVFIPFPLARELTHLRIMSEYPLGISTMMPMTNQFCSHLDVSIVASPGASTLDIVSLEDIVQERAKLNRSQACVCVDACDLGLGPLGPQDTCRDEPYVALNRSLYELVETPLFTLRDLFSGDGEGGGGGSGFNWTYLGLTNLTALGDGVAYWWSWTRDGNGSALEFPAAGEDLLRDWLDARNLTETNVLVGWDADADQAPTNVTVSGYIVYRLNLSSSSSAAVTDAFGQVLQSQYQLMSDSSGLVELRPVRLSDRGVACRAGTHCSACGPSNRVSPLPLPGVLCRLSEYQERLLSDFENRTDHFYSRASLTTDFLDASATKGKFTVRKRFQFTRDTVRLSRGPCQDCDGLFRCTTGECVTNLRLCPSPVRYNCPGNGCTRVSVNDKRYSCACDVGWGGNDCSLQYCVPGDPYKGEINPARWCNCGQFPPLKAKPPFTMERRTRALTTAQLVRAMNNFRTIKPGDFQSYPFMPSFASFGDAVLRVFLNQTTGNPRPVYTTCWFYKRGPFGQPISYFDSVIIDPDTLQIAGWRAFDTPASLNANNNESLKATYVWTHPFAYDEFPFRCPSGACVATEDECFVEANVNPPCGVGGKCKVDGTCECFPGRTTFVYTQDWTNRSAVPYDAENPVTWGKLVVPLPNRQRCNARDCSDGKCDIPMGCFPGSKAAGFLDAHVACASNTGNVGMCGVDQTACRRGEVVPPGPCSYLGLPRQRDYRPDEWYCECGELRTKLTELQDDPSANSGREVAELKKNGWGGPVCENYYCKEVTGVVRYETRDPLTLLPYVDHEQQVLAGKWTGGSCGAPIGPNPDHIIQWIACCPNVPHTSWGFARCENVLCTIASQTQCVPISKCTGVGHRPMVYPCNGKGKPRADGTCECQTDKLAGVGYGPDESGVGCYKQITCPKARNGRACNYAQQNAEHWTELPKVEYWESQIPTLLLREGVIPSYANMVSRLVTGPQDMKDLVITSSTYTARRVRDAITALQSCIYLHNASDTNCSAPFGMLPYCGSESVVGPYGKGYSVPYHILPDRVLMSGGVNVSAQDSFLFDRLVQQIGTDVTYLPPQRDVNYAVLTPSTNLTVTFSDPTTTVSVIRVFGRLMDATGTAPAAANRSAVIGFTSLTDGTGEQVMVCGDMTFFGGSAAWTWGGGTNLALYCESVWREYVFDETASAYLTFCGQLPSGSTCRNWKTSQCLTIPGLRLQNTNAAVSEFPGCPLTAVCCEPLTPPRPPVSHLTLSLSSNSTAGVSVAIQELVVIGYTRTSPPIAPALSVELSYLNGNKSIPVECRDELNLQRLLGENLGYYLPIDYSQGAGGGTVVSNQSYVTANEQCEQSGGVLAASRGGEIIGDYARVYGEACFRDTSLREGDKCLVAARNRYEPSEYKTEDFIEPDCSQWGCYICPDGTATGCSFSNEYDIVSVNPTRVSQWNQTWASGIQPWAEAHRWLNWMEYEAWGVGVPANKKAKPDNYLVNNASTCTVILYTNVFCGTLSRTIDYRGTLSSVSSFTTSHKSYKVSGDAGCIADIYYYDASTYTWSGVRQSNLGVCYNFREPSSGGFIYLYRPETIALIEIGIRAPPSGQRFYDEIELGWESSPYVCSRVEVRLRQIIVRGIRPVGTELQFEELYGPSTVVDLAGSTGYFELDNRHLLDGTYVVIDLAKFADERNWVNNIHLWGSPEYASSVGLGNCGSLGRRVRPCLECPIPQLGLWEWDQRHYDPLRLRFNQPVGRMNQLVANENSRVVNPEIYVNVQFADGSIANQLRLDSMCQRGRARAYASMCTLLNATIHYNTKMFLDNCVAVARNPPSSVSVNYTLQPVVCVAQPRHYALCMRTWLKHAVQPGRLGDKCGASCRKGAQPQPGRTAYDENALADARRFPDEHAIYQAWLQGTLEEMFDRGEMNYQGVWEFLRYTLNESLVWSFDEARQFLRESKSTRPKRTSPGSAEDYHRWLDFNWRQTWPVDCGVQCSRETGVCRPMLAVASKFCKPDAEGQFPTKALVPESEFPLDLIPISDVNRTIGVARCAEMIDPSMYGKTTANGRPSPTNRDFIVLEEIEREHVTLKATRAGLNSWHNTGKVDHLYQLRNDTVLYGTFACSPRCPTVQVWAHRISPFYETTNERVVLGTFNASSSSSGTTTFTTAALGPAFNGTQYRAFGFDFFNLTRYTVVKIGVLLAHDASTIAECTKPLSDRLRQHEEPPASIQLPNTQNECVFEYDAEDDLYRKVPGQCYCSDIAWGGPSCESPAVVTLLKGKRVCAGWGRPGYQTVRDGALVKVDEDGVWHHQDQTGCVCMNPGLVIRTRLDPITRYAYPSIFVSEKKFGDREFTYKSAVSVTAGGVRPRYTFTESARICAEESGDLPWFVSGDEVEAFAAALGEMPAENNTVFVDLTREVESGTIRWNMVGGSALYRCPDNATTPDPECGTSVGGGGLCSTDDVNLCRAVHHNNLALNGTYANATTRNLTDGRLDTEYHMPTGQSVYVTVPNRLGQVANSTGLMRVEVLAMDGDTNYLEVFRASTGMSCTRDFGYYATRPSADLKFGARVAYVFKCPAYDAFQIQWTGFVTIRIAEVYAYDELDENRYYNYH